ncbi:hypothetical protein OPIT5_23615 [Opitutaceae bacterium TAV5]|nr:hypothetical protein OPIT5_23615 [Opitutaceae bacterium TAV5]
MKVRLLSLYAALSALLLPTSLLADEPSRGTVVMVSSIGTWVILSSIFTIRKRHRKAASATDTAKPDQQS